MLGKLCHPPRRAGKQFSMSKNAILTSRNAWQCSLHVEESDSDIAECLENYATHQGEQENSSPCRRTRFLHRGMRRNAGEAFSMSKNAILTSRNASQRRRSILHVEERDFDI